MVIRHHTFIGKWGEEFSSGFFESGIHYVPRGRPTKESIEKHLMRYLKM